MSDDATMEFLQSGGASVQQSPGTIAQPGDSVQAFLESGGEHISTGPTPYQSAMSSMNGYPPAVEGTLGTIGNMAKGVAGSVVGGWGGITDLVTGKGINQASEDVQSGQDRWLTPPVNATQSAEEQALGSQYSPLTWPQRLGAAAGSLEGRLGGGPGLQTAVETGVNAIPYAFGFGRMAAKESPQIAPPSAQGVVDKAFADSPQSAGSAATAPNLSTLSPEVRSEIVRSARTGNINPSALTRQIQADEFGIQLTKGQARQDPAQLANEFNTRNENPEFAERKTQTNGKLIEGVNGLKNDVAPGVPNDMESNGQTVIDAYKAKYAPIAADARAKWLAFQNAAGGALPIETGDFVSKVSDALKTSGKTRYLPSDVAGDIQDISNGEPFTVERWDNLKTNLAQAQRTAQRTGNGNAGLAIGAVRDAVENYDFPNLDPQLKALNDSARQATAAKYAMLKADPAMDAAVNDGIPHGQLSPDAKGFIERYFLKGSKADLANAQKNLSDNPDAQGAVAGSVVNLLKKNAGIDLYRDEGNFSASGYNRTLNELQPRINYLLPQTTADKAFRLGNVARDTMAQPTGPAFNNSGTSVAAQVAKRIGSGAARGAEAVANMATGKIKLGTGVREEVSKFTHRNWVKDSLKPGAGIEND